MADDHLRPTVKTPVFDEVEEMDHNNHYTTHMIAQIKKIKKSILNKTLRIARPSQT